MKFSPYIGIILLLTLTACPPKRNNKDELKQIQDNHMDFPKLRKMYYNSIHYKLSELFSQDYNKSYVIQDVAETRAIYSMDLKFSIEVFTEDEAELMEYVFEDEINSFDAVHDNYVLKRASTLIDPMVSIKKETPSSVGFPGYIQVIEGSYYDYQDPLSYFTATLNIDGEYYVFQLIGKQENMGYLYDDFIDILSSVEK